MQKIGKGYYQSGYGRGFKPIPVVRLINGKAYVKDAQASPFETDMPGHVMVNKFATPNGEMFCEVGLISKHELYNQANPIP